MDAKGITPAAFGAIPFTSSHPALEISLLSPSPAGISRDGCFESRNESKRKFEGRDFVRSSACDSLRPKPLPRSLPQPLLPSDESDLESDLADELLSGFEMGVACQHLVECMTRSPIRAQKSRNIK